MKQKNLILLIKIFITVILLVFFYDFYQSNQKRFLNIGQINFLYSSKSSNTNAISESPKDLKKNSLNKYIIYECDGLCGGWADRLKGILSVYALALLTDRIFIIKITQPCNFDQLFLPNKIDFNKNVEVDQSSMTFLHLIDFNDIRNRANEIDFLEFHNDKRFIRIKTNNILINKFSINKYLQKKIIELGFSPEKFKFRLLFKQWYNDLFKLAPKLQTQYEKALEELNVKNVRAKLICAQIRIGGKKLNDFQFNEIDVSKKFWKFINETFILNKINDNNFKIFISTDTLEVIEEAQKIFGNDKIIKLPGMHTHVDREGNLGNNCSRVEKSFLDFHFIQNCDSIVISQSGYGMISALNRPDPTLDLYKYNNKFVKLNDTSQLHEDL